MSIPAKRLILDWVTLGIFLISLPSIALSNDAPAPGQRFREVVQLLDDEELLTNIEAKAKLASGLEASLIRLLGDVASQCMKPGDSGECTFRPTKNAQEWPDMTPYLERHLRRGEFEAIGALFKCSVDQLEGAREGEYLDCLKQSELKGLE